MIATDAQPVNSPTPQAFTLHLALTNKQMKWFCIQCRNLLFFSHHRVITISEDEPLEFFSPPITIICSKCRSHYSLQTIV